MDKDIKRPIVNGKKIIDLKYFRNRKYWLKKGSPKICNYPHRYLIWGSRKNQHDKECWQIIDTDKVELLELGIFDLYLRKDILQNMKFEDAELAIFVAGYEKANRDS